MDLKSFRRDKLKYKTPAEFAQVLGVAESDVEKWESNPDTMPYQAIQRILVTTGVSYEELTGWEKPKLDPLSVKDAWNKVDFTKGTLVDYLSSALDRFDISEESQKAYIDDLRNGVESTLVKPKVAIVGRSDTGKSTLINALLGADKMPTSWTPTTSIAVYIKHISDRPSFIKDPVWAFANQVGKDNIWNEHRLQDEEYCNQWKIAAGDVDILSSFGTRQGNNYNKAAGSAVIFLDSPILKNCDIVDLPGFGTETESDDNITFAVAQKADVVVYLSQANGFMRIEDITYLKRNIHELPVIEKKGENSLKPLSNLFVVASQAHTINNGNREQIKNILDVGCKNLIKTLPSDYWSDRATVTGYNYTDNGYPQLRSRFFAYTIDIPDICAPFNTALKEILEALPSIIDKRAKEYVKDYVQTRKPNLIKEVQKYEGLIAERDKYVRLLEEIDANELERVQTNNAKKDDVRKSISQLKAESINEFSEYMASTFNVDAIVQELKNRGVKNKKDDLELFGSSLQSAMQQRCEKILEQKSKVLSEKAKEYVASFSKSTSAPFENVKIDVDFDAGWAFASALSAIGLVGGFGAFVASTIYGTILFTGLAGISFGTAVTFGVLTSSVFGPIGIGIGLLIAGGLGIAKLFGGGWEKTVAKQIVKTIENENVAEKYRDAISKYWTDSEDAFNQAADKLDQDWNAYVAKLHDTVDEYDVDQIQSKIAELNNLTVFFDNIPL